MNLEKLKNELSYEELLEMVSEVNCYNGHLDDLYYYENDEWFFQDFFQNKVDDAIRAVCYGDYNYMDDYVHFNAYGNLDSCNEFQLQEEIESRADDIIEEYIDIIDEVSNGELKNKVKKYMEAEDETINN